MTDELAKRLVALGIAKAVTDIDGNEFYYIKGAIPRHEAMNADLFCQDGRVVLAAMERVLESHTHIRIGKMVVLGRTFVEVIDTRNHAKATAENGDRTIAILTACCDALEAKDG